MKPDRDPLRTRSQCRGCNGASPARAAATAAAQSALVEGVVLALPVPGPDWSHTEADCGHVGHRDREGAGNQLVGFLHRLRRGGDARPEYLCGPKDHMDECARRAPWRL